LQNTSVYFLIAASTDLAVSRTVFSNGIGFQLNVAIVLLMSASMVFPIKGNIPFISLLKFAINFSKNDGATVVLTLSYPFDFKICAIVCIAYGFSVVTMKRWPFAVSFYKAATWIAAISLTSDITV
jgi:hypothetical protein